MIDTTDFPFLDRVDQLTVADLAALLCVTLMSAWRLMRLGRRTADGQRIFLRVRKVRGKLMTCRRWLNEFYTAIEEADRAHFGRAANGPFKANEPAKVIRRRLSEAKREGGPRPDRRGVAKEVARLVGSAE